MQEPDQLTIIYKLGTLEALMTTGMNHIKEQINDVKELVETNKKETKVELESIKTRLDRIEDWKKAVVERVTVITGACLLIWTIIGDQIKEFISKVF